MSDPSRKGESGMSLVELTIAIALTAIVMVAAIMTMRTGSSSSKDLITDMDSETALQEVLQGISRELRWSSRQGEDTNENSILDTGEDTNNNSRFENDWNLTASSVTFNVLRADGGFALPVTYTLVGDELRRINQLDAAGKQAVTVLTRGVTGFTVTDTGSGITVSLSLQTTSQTGRVKSHTRSITVRPRN